MRVRVTVTQAVPRSRCGCGQAGVIRWAVRGHGASPQCTPEIRRDVSRGGRDASPMTQPSLDGRSLVSQNIHELVLSPVPQISVPLDQSQPPGVASRAAGRRREWGQDCPRSPAHLFPLPGQAERHASGPPAQDEEGPSQCPPYTAALILLLGHPRAKKYNT